MPTIEELTKKVADLEKENARLQTEIDSKVIRLPAVGTLGFMDSTAPAMWRDWGVIVAEVKAETNEIKLEYWKSREAAPEVYQSWTSAKPFHAAGDKTDMSKYKGGKAMKLIWENRHKGR